MSGKRGDKYNMTGRAALDAAKHKKFNTNMPTIYEVAVMSNVSIKTVSRVLNGSALVAPATRDKVESVICKLQYKPNMSARRLASDRNYHLGIILDENNSDYSASDILSVSKACAENFYALTIVGLEECVTIKHINRISKEKKLDGILVLSDNVDDDVAALKNELAAPINVISNEKMAMSASERAQVSATAKIRRKELLYNSTQEVINRIKASLSVPIAPSPRA